ncbi:unnamed protein product [Linum trigynum]|uniref:RNase H type-1 domain-containing protein n=1 Tax=Linum trigynum TaxID=586398 RepID=A0AAV2CHK4_9ROSI
MENSTDEELGSFVTALWFRWKERNNHLFNNPKLELWEIIARSEQYMEAYITTQVKNTNLVTKMEYKWEKPRADSFKVNVDAAILKEEGTGFGLVGRDGAMIFIMTATHQTRTAWSPELAEAKAIFWALNLSIFTVIDHC